MAQIMATNIQAILEDQVVVRQIHLEVLDHLILGAQAQQGREILENNIGYKIH